MPTADDSFRPVDETDTPMHGSSAVILAGFEPDQQDMIRRVLNQQN